MNNEPDYKDNLYFERINKMTQKIFDTDNAEDMALLWSILPDMVKRIEKDDIDSSETTIPYNRYMGSDYCIGGCPYIAINWHDKKEITRPIQEATEADIGQICYFWNDDDPSEYGQLLYVFSSPEYRDGKYQQGHNEGAWSHCRRLTKQEIEELC